MSQMQANRITLGARASCALLCALIMGAAMAQPSVPAPLSAPGTTGIDSSGNTARERAACMTGATQQAQDTCLREAANAAAEQRKGGLEAPPGADLKANAMRRCEALGGDDRADCETRVQGGGQATGSVAGGGVLREVETVVPAPRP